MNSEKIVAALDALEKIVENSGGMFGKRLINEEEFWVQTQNIRAALSESEPVKPPSPWSDQK